LNTEEERDERLRKTRKVKKAFDNSVNDGRKPPTSFQASPSPEDYCSAVDRDVNNGTKLLQNMNISNVVSVRFIYSYV
jgi:hypothetical protein